MGKSTSSRFMVSAAVSLALALAPGSAQAAIRTVLMDAFTPVFQFTPGGQVVVTALWTS